MHDGVACRQNTYSHQGQSARAKHRWPEQPSLLGVPMGQTMTILTEFGVENKVEAHMVRIIPKAADFIA